MGSVACILENSLKLLKPTYLSGKSVHSSTMENSAGQMSTQTFGL